MPNTELPLFNAENLVFWAVDGTAMTVVTDAEIPPGKVRENMRRDLAKAEQLEVTVPCVHFSDSFQGIAGTHINGRGWKLHKPKSCDGGLWEMARYASTADWTEIQEN